MLAICRSLLYKDFLEASKSANAAAQLVIGREEIHEVLPKILLPVTS